jgi:hypothetical protein
LFGCGCGCVFSAWLWTCFIGFLFEAKTILLLKEKPQGRIYMCARCFCTFFLFFRLKL